MLLRINLSHWALQKIIWFQLPHKKTGDIGDYVAMAWPPMRATEIIINEITGINQVENQVETKEDVMGAWSNINKKEISRIPLL